MRARHHTFKVIATVTIGHREAAIFHHDPNTGNTHAVVMNGATTCSDTTDDGHATGNSVTFNFDRGPGKCGPPQRIRCFSTVHRLSRTGVRAYDHGISDPSCPPTGDVAKQNFHPRSVRSDLNRIRRRRAIDPDGVRTQAQPARWLVYQHNVALYARGIGIACGDRVENRIAWLNTLARSCLGQRDIQARPVERDIDLDRRRIGQRQVPAERCIFDNKGAAIGARQTRQCFPACDGGRSIGFGRLHIDAICAEEGEREPIVARRHRIDIAGAIGDRLTRDHG